MPVHPANQAFAKQIFFKEWGLQWLVCTFVRLRLCMRAFGGLRQYRHVCVCVCSCTSVCMCMCVRFVWHAFYITRVRACVRPCLRVLFCGWVPVSYLCMWLSYFMFY
jgi:hypothetical protein